MPKKGTPQYEEWLRKYRQHHPEKVEESSSYQRTSADEKTKVEQPALFSSPKVETKDFTPYGKGTKVKVYSKSQNKELHAQIIRWAPDKAKYLISREDGKIMYKPHVELIHAQSAQKPQTTSGVPVDSTSAKIEAAVKPAVFAIMSTGLFLNKGTLDRLHHALEDKRTKLRTALNILAGEEFNPLSSEDTGRIIFGKLGIKSPDASSSTSKTVLEAISDKHPIIPKIIEYRSTNKLISGYTAKLKNETSPDGRVRNLLSPEAVSGRFTSKGMVKKVLLTVPDSLTIEDRVYSKAELSKHGVDYPCV